MPSCTPGCASRRARSSLVVAGGLLLRDLGGDALGLLDLVAIGGVQLGAPLSRQLLLLGHLDLVLAAGRATEILDTAAERIADRRQLSSAEDQQDDQQD